MSFLKNIGKPFDMTKGDEAKSIIKFAVPLALGNVFQQIYNLADTLIVGRYVGEDALAAVGSTYSLMIFITSILIGLCIGASVVFSKFYGKKDSDSLQKSFFISFIIIGLAALIINAISLIYTEPILSLIKIPDKIMDLSLTYTFTVFWGIFFVFLYNFYSGVFRSMGNSVSPLIFLVLATIINIILDLVFIIYFDMGVFGAALATLIAQIFSGLGLSIACHRTLKEINIKKENRVFEQRIVFEIINFSSLSSIQQSVMNLGILMIQALVNSFGVTVMAGFTCAVKFDTLAYVPVQDFGNACSTFMAQNLGEGKYERISRGTKSSFKILTLVCIPISIFVFVFAPNPSFGVQAIWWSIPIGWLIADIIGFIKMRKEKIIR